MCLRLFSYDIKPDQKGHTNQGLVFACHVLTHKMYDILIYSMACMQCTIGWFSGAGATVCSVCSAGKYLSNAAGGVEASSCTSVSVLHNVLGTA
jgi:hypothetical protein